MVEENFYRGTGRRKTSVAEVRLYEGKGNIEVNGKDVDAYFSVPRRYEDVLAPLKLTGTRSDYDIIVNAHGGGPTGQAGAIRLGISRALSKVDKSYHDTLKKEGMLTRDARMVERKKAGSHKARRGKQFSKR